MHSDRCTISSDSFPYQSRVRERRDLHALKDSLRLIPDVKAQLQNCSSVLLVSLNDTLDPLPDLIALIEHGIHPNPPATIREGGIINDGYSEELDELRRL